MRILLTSAFICFFFSACSNSPKPEYILTDSQLHQYKDGDTLRYGVVSLNSDATGALTHSFDAVDLSAPTPTNETLRVISRSTQIEGNIQFPFPIPYFTHAANGSLMLNAYSESGKTFWLSDDGSTAANTEIYPSPLSDLIEQTTVNMPQFSYVDFVRRDGGVTTLTISPLGVETQETNYATFQTHKINIDWSVTVQDNEQKTYRLSGTQWVYPPLGVVMFNYRIQSPSGSSNEILGSLSATNIKIPTENKKVN